MADKMIHKCIEYTCQQADCMHTEHIVMWLNKMGRLGWEMCGRVRQRSRNPSKSGPTFYFKRVVSVDVEGDK